MTRSALVTGAAGLVGRQLCRALVDRNWRVAAGYRRNGSPHEINGVTGEFLPMLSEPERWQHVLRSIDCVVHLAAHVHQMGRADGRNDKKFDEINNEGTRFVAQQCVRAGVRRLVFLSSIKVNGEGGDRAYDAADEPAPQDAYARSKLAAEFAIRDICGPAGIEFAIIRPPLVYGPGVRANFHRLLTIADHGLPLPLGSIDNRRSLIGVRNLAAFIAICLSHPEASGQVWLISDGEDLSTAMLMRKLRRLMQKPERLFACPPGWLQGAANLAGLGSEMRRLCESLVVNAAPARERLGWRPGFSVDEELAATVEAFRAERNR